MTNNPAYEALARVLTEHSTKLKKGDHVLLDAHDTPESFVIALLRAVRKCGAFPFVQLHSGKIAREMALGISEQQASTILELDLARMKKMQAYICVRGSKNIAEMADVPQEKMNILSETLKPLSNYRVNKTRWVVLRWPTDSMAQQAHQSTEAFEEFFFRVCTLDYARMQPGMKALKDLMDRTDRVAIKGPGTDLRFSIKGIGSVMCGGEFNIPDGEVFSCPVKNSVEGEITFNAPTIYRGIGFENIHLVFAKGKIIKATSSDTKALNEILDTDPGARYIGEFSLGFNPHILDPMRDILFDEKIAGSFHFTPGQAYEIAGNKNKSAIHWDMVSIQRKDYGGGEIWFDDVLIRKDGLFTQPALRKLNPDQLLKTRK
ncbi:MAG: aminopeptidase [Chthoniobacterales bacterium]|nr:aminopeptidase [Chthoniobacterales bacterium]